MNMKIYVWLAMMVRRGEYKKVLKHAKVGHTLLMMAWCMTQVGEVVLLWYKRVESEMPNKEESKSLSFVKTYMMK